MTAAPTKADRILVLYASQTGNAEYIAKNIHSQAVERGYQSECHVMDDFEKIPDLTERPLIVFVSSTTGDGDPPDNALKWWRRMRALVKENPQPFAKTRYTILGLGDTNYSNFGAHPKRIDKKMQEMGAQSFYKVTIADEVEGLENTVDPWIEALWPVLDKECKHGVAKADGTAEGAPPESRPETPLQQLTIADRPAVIIDKDAPKLPLPYDKLASIEELTNVAKLPSATCSVVYTGVKVAVPSDPNQPYLKAPPAVENSAPLDHSKYHLHHPFYAKIYRARCLTTGDSVKRTLHVELDISGLGWSYVPGDAFGILAPNEHHLVLSILARLGLVADAEFRLEPVADGGSKDALPSHVHSPCTVYQLFRNMVDVCAAPRKAFYRLLAEYCTDLQEKKMLLFLCSRQGSEVVKELTKTYSPTLLDYLNSFASCVPPLERLLDVLPALAPRHYSITSSPAVEGDATMVHCAFNVVAYERPAPMNDHREGVCTPFLDRLCGQPPALQSILDAPAWTAPPQPAYVPIFPHPSKDFLVPEDDSIPWIMIGPGTGIAPFLGFCKHRQMRNRKKIDGKGEGEVWLFFGCRNADKDYLYRRELEEMVAEKVVTRLVTTFSRDPQTPSDKKYVQHRLLEHGKDVYRMMTEQKGRLFVCGDAAGMAKDVNDALVRILMTQGGLAEMDAIKLVGDWMQSKRYVRDIWA